LFKPRSAIEFSVVCSRRGTGLVLYASSETETFWLMNEQGLPARFTTPEPRTINITIDASTSNILVGFPLTIECKSYAKNLVIFSALVCDLGLRLREKVIETSRVPRIIIADPA